MLLLILFAFLAGIVTVLSPCILPVLPVVLSGSVGGGKARPLGIISGFLISFTLFTLTLSAIVKLFNISADVLRYVAAGLIIIFGLVMVIPPFKNFFIALVSRISSKAGPSGSGGDPEKKKGYWSGFTLGLSLGLVWTPCVGPIMASVITLSLTASVDFGAFIITLAYALGTAIPLFLIMQGGRTLLNKFPFFTKHSESIQKVFGVLMLVTGIALVVGWDRQFQNAILTAFPEYGTGLTQLEQQDFLRQEIQAREEQLLDNENSDQGLPETQALYESLSLGGPWINSEPLTPADLEGKVVLIDFWTYSCINCIRTLPYLEAWHEAYKDDGLVIIGVHSPEFAFEQVTENVKKAVADYGLKYAVVQDNDFKIWRTFNNRFWPAHYIFSRTGKLTYTHFGEGKYDETEKVIQNLLGESGALVSMNITPTESDTASKTPETYLGYGRAEAFNDPTNAPNNNLHEFAFPASLELNQWALSGQWVRRAEHIQAAGTNSKLELSFRAKKVYLVLGLADENTKPMLKITVDGQPVNTADVKNGLLQVNGHRLYELYTGGRAIEGLLIIETSEPVNAFAFTFG